MTGLSRCGRQYKTFDSALLAAELRTSKGARPPAPKDGSSCSQSVSKPGSVPFAAAARSDSEPRPPHLVEGMGYVRVLNYATRGVPVYPTCDGGWNDQP